MITTSFVRCKANRFGRFAALTCMIVVTGPLAEVHAATIDWVDFTDFGPGAQSQDGLNSADGLVVNVAYSNLTNFAPGAPNGLLASLANVSPAWPFTNTDVPYLVSFGPGNAGQIDTVLSVTFTNPGGLAAGGSLGFADLETAGSFVQVAAFNGASPVPVDNWLFATFNNSGSPVPAPSWNPATATLTYIGASSAGVGVLDSFAFLTTLTAIDRVEIRLVGAEGDGIGVAISQDAVSPVPLPSAIWLLATGLAAAGGFSAMKRTRQLV